MVFDRPHRVLGCWTTVRRLGFPLPAVFIACFATKPVSSETSKAERRSSGVHSSIWDSWPIAFSGHPRGPRVLGETGCRSTQRLTSPLRLALEPECLENPTATARGIPRMERIRSEPLKLFVVSDDWRRSALLSSTRSEQSWQSSAPGSA